MKKNYKLNKIVNGSKMKLSRLVMALILTIGTSSFFIAQPTYTFTNAGATGRLGPSQGQVNTAYALTNLNGNVVSTNGIQSWTVPTTGSYRIEAYGASGGTVSGFSGFGAKVMGDVFLTSGTVLQILAGQMGSSFGTGNSDGGGGGSFVAAGGTLLLAAGGGGGAAQLTSTSQNASLLSTVVNGLPAQFGSEGAGYSVNGVHFLYAIYTTVAQAFTNGGNGQAGGQAGGWPGGTYGEGGFGGGGSSCSCSTGGGGGGGGYVGGGGGGGTYQSGTGGSSYVIGTAANTATTQLSVYAHGKVVITALCNINLTNSSTTGPGPICAGNSATITTNAISNYVWSNGNSTSSIVVTPSVTTAYTLTATSPSNCTASSIITITVNTTPTISTVTSASVICSGKPVVLTASGLNTYTWTGGATNGIAFTPTATTDYTVVGTNACGTSSAIASVTVNALPNITASVNNPTVCNGSSIILNGGGSASGYTWSPVAPNNSAFAPPASTNYVVTGAGANGCTNTAVAGVTVLVTPTIVPVASPNAVCFGVTATLSAVGATGYTWTPGTNLTSATVAVSPPVSTTYTLFRTNGACSSTSTVNLVINPLPLVNASATPSQICAGTGINLLVFGAITYTWLPGGFTISNFTVYPNFSTNYTVTGSNGNCTTTVVVPVLVNQTPTISISSSTTTICQGNSVSLSASGGVSYTWQPSASNLSSIVVSPATTTIINCTTTNSLGCTASQNQLILVNPLPNMSLTSSSPFICVGQTAQLSITAPTTNVVYNWNTGPTGTSISANPSVTTNYFATGTNTVTGCTNTNTIALSVYISTFVVTSPTAICKGETATLTASGPATTFSWTVNGGVTAPSVTVSPVLSTIYYVTGSNVSCSNTQSVNLIVNPIPNVSASTAKSTICRFEVSTITGNGATSYSWNTGASTPTISFTLSVTTTYTLTGTDVNACAKTVTVTQYVATCIGIEDLTGNNNAGLNVYPNPNNGNFTVKTDVAITLNVVNALGQLVQTVKLAEDNKQELMINNLPNGIYFITGESNGLKVNKKIIVEK